MLRPTETREFSRVVARARREARRLRKNWVFEEHLLLGIILNERNAGALALKSQIELSLLLCVTEALFGYGEEEEVGVLELTPGVRRVLISARKEEARILGHDRVGPSHLLLALFREPRGVVRQILDVAGVDLRKVRTDLSRNRRTIPTRSRVA